MIRHIVLFKLIDFPLPEQKTAAVREIKTRLEALRDTIPVVRMIRVDGNVNPQETWDIILTVEVDSLAHLEAYANHPAHLAVSKEVIAPIKANRACVDYEF